MTKQFNQVQTKSIQYTKLLHTFNRDSFIRDNTDGR